MTAESIPSTSSYLDLEDPFHTVSSQTSTKINFSSQASELSDGEISDDSVCMDDVTTRNNRKNSNNSNGDEDNANYSESIHELDMLDEETKFVDEQRLSAREILDAPSEWKLACFNETESTPREKISPQQLRQQTNELLEADAKGEAFSVSPDDLRMLVKTAARLVSEHDQLLTNRNRLLEAMNEMHTTERDAAKELLSQLPLDSIDEESRRIIYHMANKLGELGPCPSDEDLLGNCLEEAGADANVPHISSSESADVISSDENVKIAFYSVPPPDTTRPPPRLPVDGFPLVPDLCRLPPLSVDVSTPPPSLLHSGPFAAPPGGMFGKFQSLMEKPPHVLSPMVPMFSPPCPLLNRTPLRPPYVNVIPPMGPMPMPMQPMKFPVLFGGPPQPFINRRFSAGMDYRRGRGRGK